MWIIIYFVHRIQKPNLKVNPELPNQPNCYWQKRRLKNQERFVKNCSKFNHKIRNIQSHSFGIGDLIRWARYFEIKSLRHVRCFDIRKSLKFKQYSLKYFGALLFHGKALKYLLSKLTHNFKQKSVFTRHYTFKP